MIKIKNPITGFTKNEFKLAYRNKTVVLSDVEECEISTEVEKQIDAKELQIGTDRNPPKKKINKIISITGDDKIVSGENRYVTAVELFVPNSIFKTDIISKHDTNITKMLGNYTEGYVMYAPHRNATFESVTRKFKGQALPLTFDTLKLKQFLPNTKGRFTKVDLADKMEQAFKQTEWINEHWIGKTYAELMKIVMLSCFDFRNARSFPMLYKSEGGCGGTPPFNNLDTLESALFHYKGGKAKQGILKIMEESVYIQKGNLKPSQGVSTQMMHLAQTGLDVGKLKSFLNDKFFKKATIEEKEEYISLLTEREELPKEIMEKSVLIEPENKFLGCIISELRSEGFVMTELDVRMAILHRLKFEALLGDKPIGEVLQELEEKKRKEKSFLKKAMFEDYDTENITSPDLKLVASRYYQMRKDRSEITGLSYSGRIRIFDTDEIKSMLEENSFGLVDEVLTNLDTFHEGRARQKYGRAITKHNRMVEAMKAGVSQLIRNLPEGVGADDARIGLKVSEIDKNTPVFVVTDDRQMTEILPNFHPNTFRIPLYEYLKINPTTNPRKVKKEGVKVRVPQSSSNSVAYIKTKEMEKFRGKKAAILYDYANINRRLEARKSGLGYFPLSEAKMIPYGELSWDSFKNLDTFQNADASKSVRLGYY